MLGFYSGAFFVSAFVEGKGKKEGCAEKEPSCKLHHILRMSVPTTHLGTVKSPQVCPGIWWGHSELDLSQDSITWPCVPPF